MIRQINKAAFVEFKKYTLQGGVEKIDFVKPKLELLKNLKIETPSPYFFRKIK